MTSGLPLCFCQIFAIILCKGKRILKEICILLLAALTLRALKYNAILMLRARHIYLYRSGALYSFG